MTCKRREPHHQHDVDTDTKDRKEEIRITSEVKSIVLGDCSYKTLRKMELVAMK